MKRCDGCGRHTVADEDKASGIILCGDCRSGAIKPSGIALIAAERQRQMDGEGWTPEHDDEHDQRQMHRAAFFYADPRVTSKTPVPVHWPWADEWWKPSDDRIRNMVKAAALIAAEIDRLQRQSANKD